MAILEICCTSMETALTMLQAGAHRVELCSVLECGGLTPTWLSRLRDYPSLSRVSPGDTPRLFPGDMDSSVANQPSPDTLNSNLLKCSHVLIRCRPGDFCYTQAEVDEMCQSIRLCREIGVKGVVIGALTPDRDLDITALHKMIHVATGQSETVESTDPKRALTIVFHRAFDECRTPLRTMEQLIQLNFDSILTSGQAPTADQGIPLLKQLVVQAANRINIMAGRGVTVDNVARIIQETGVPAVHLSQRGGISRILHQIQKATP
ncbi:MAG: copper homeostasis protein CutC [Bacteroidales bacterium]|nr:copper homeostasis protein CutC [Bacteroidales bacterium]MDD4654331.1 copper homeostasis protein CutC [Bacteroidales bacterium]MDD4827673.1 copper homeostasis protein CutC [Bacteroidales bacterium]